MENNFDLRKFLSENKLTKNSKLLSEEEYMDGDHQVSNSARKEIKDVIMNYSEYEGKRTRASLAPDLFGEDIIAALEGEGIDVPQGMFNRRMEDALEGIVLDLESGEDIDKLVDDAIAVVMNPSHYGGGSMNEMGKSDHQVSNSARKEIKDVIISYSSTEDNGRSTASLAPDLFGEYIIDVLEASGIDVPQGMFNRRMEDALEGIILDLESGEDIDKLVDDAIAVVMNPSHYGGGSMNEMEGEGSVEVFLDTLGVDKNHPDIKNALANNDFDDAYNIMVKTHRSLHPRFIKHAAVRAGAPKEFIKYLDSGEDTFRYMGDKERFRR